MREIGPAGSSRSPLQAWALACVVAALSWGCGRSTTRTQGGETNFLQRCNESCEAGYVCLSGVCTFTCDTDDACGDLPGDAQCASGGGDDEGRCDVACSRNSDCDDLGATYDCEGGFCRAAGAGASVQSPQVDAGTGSPPAGSDGPPNGTGGEAPTSNGGGASGPSPNPPPGLPAGTTPLGAADDLAAPLSFRFWSKLDLLLMIDNSISMADKQTILAQSVPQLVERLANPVCVDAAGNLTSTSSVNEDCPTGAARQFPPLGDIHVGIVTSSMGDAGANEACVFEQNVAGTEQKVDNGYLLGSLPRGGQIVPGFLAWTGGDAPTFSGRLRDQVIQAGESGCGYEASLEAWYHFLVDPTPWSAIDVIDCAGQAAGSGNCRQPRIVQPDGTLGDPVILAQRAEFLRPDSLVGVVMVTDENDCSLIVGGPYKLAAQTARRMFRGSDACAADPNDPCCYSCGTGIPTGCDDGCGGDRNLPSELDEPNLRCYEQKRRFGLDFLYPTQRYVNALTQPTLGLCSLDLDPGACESSDVARNPLFRAGDGVPSRTPSEVFLAGIVGVPYQLIQASQDASGNSYPEGELHFLTSSQLADEGGTAWNRIVGSTAERDTHMLESIASTNLAGRPGLPTAGSAPGSDPFHGHEWTSARNDDLQYACIMPLPEPRDCDSPELADGQRACECRGAGEASYTENNPLCYQDGQYGSLQVAAKAYPGLRHLEVLRGFGDQTGNAIVGSICARNVDGDPRGQDFGYNPTMSSIVEHVRPKLVPGCLPRSLAVESVDGERRGRPECRAVEVTQGSSECKCLPEERRVPASDASVRQIVDTGVCASVDDCDLCFCELLPAGADANGEVTDREAYASCQSEETPDVDGWCYVDADVPVITGDAQAEVGKNALVAGCPGESQRFLRFAGEGGLTQGSIVWISCAP